MSGVQSVKPGRDRTGFQVRGAAHAKPGHEEGQPL